MQELSYKLEKDVQEFMTLLEQMVAFITQYNLLTDASDINKFQKLKIKLAEFEKNNVDLVNYDYKPLYKTSMTFVHPDKYGKLPSEALKNELEQYTSLINGNYQELASDLNKAKQIGLTECFRSGFTNNQPEQNTNDSRPNYQSNSQQYNQQNSYYQQPPYSQGYSGNQQQSYYESGSTYNQQQSSYNSSQDQRQSHRSNQQQEAYYQRYEDDDFDQDAFTRVSDFIRGRWDAVVHKIPSSEHDFENIKNFYLKRLKNFELKIIALNKAIEKNDIETSNTKKQWEIDLFPNNVQRVYQDNERKIYATLQQSYIKIDEIYAQIQQRERELTPLITQKKQAFYEYANNLNALYMKELQLVQGGANKQLYYSIYPGTTKTYADVLKEKYELLMTFGDLSQEYRRIQDETLDNDQTYQELDKKYDHAVKETERIDMQHRNYLENHEAEVRKIVQSINNHYNSKLRELSNNKNYLLKKLQSFTQKRTKINEQYNVYLTRYQPVYGAEQKRGGR